jgi:hypothetical protein
VSQLGSKETLQAPMPRHGLLIVVWIAARLHAQTDRLTDRHKDRPTDNWSHQSVPLPQERPDRQKRCCLFNMRNGDWDEEHVRISEAIIKVRAAVTP